MERMGKQIRIAAGMLLLGGLVVLAGWGAAAEGAKNPFAGNAAAAKEGEKIYDDKCVECHLDGTGGAGPNIIDKDWLYGGSDAEVYESIAKGRKGGMPSWSSELKDEDIWKVITYIRSIGK